MKVLVTGVNGFIGKTLCPRLIADKYDVIGTVRHKEIVPGITGKIQIFETGEIDGQTKWEDALRGCDAVIHLAARVHIMAKGVKIQKKLYERINVDGTTNLVRQSIKNDIKRFVFISTVKVNGEGKNSPYRDTDIPLPQDYYSESKYNAEEQIKEIANHSTMDYVIIRPTLVYGPYVKANFLNLIRIIDHGFPLPFASITNKRGIIYIENLIDAILLCLQHPKAARQTYLISDEQNVSTPQLIRLIAAALKKNPHLFRFPLRILNFTGNLARRRKVTDRICGSLTVDMSKINNELGWRPRFTLEEGLKKTINWYRNCVKKNRLFRRICG